MVCNLFYQFRQNAFRIIGNGILICIFRYLDIYQNTWQDAAVSVICLFMIHYNKSFVYMETFFKFCYNVLQKTVTVHICMPDYIRHDISK